jgi:hypothetical protein
MIRQSFERIDAEIYDRRAEGLRIFFGIWLGYLIFWRLPWRSFLELDVIVFAVSALFQLPIPCFLAALAFRSFELKWYPISRMFLFIFIGVVWKILAVTGSVYDLSSYPLIYAVAGFFAYCGRKAMADKPENPEVVFHDPL